MSEKHVIDLIAAATDGNIVPIKPAEGIADWWTRTPEEQAAHLRGLADDEAAVKAAILKVTNLQWQDIRKPLSKATNWSLSYLDSLRKTAPDTTKTGQGQEIVFDMPEEWPEDETIAAVLKDIRAGIEAELYLPEHAASVMALWGAMTWLHAELNTAPYLFFTAGKPSSGKTTACETLAAISHKPRHGASNLSEAAMFRIAEMHSPTLIFDNVDEFFKPGNNKAEDIKKLILQAWKRSQAIVTRCVGDDHIPKDFTVWQPVMMNGIGKSTRDLMTRCITIGMTPRPKSKKAPPRGQWEAIAPELVSRLSTVIEKNKPALLERIEAALPDEGTREGDLWRPLVGIAAFTAGQDPVMGKDWPELVRRARAAFEPDEEESLTLAEHLLIDIHTILHEQGLEWVSLERMTELLIEHEPDRWKDYARGKPITSRAMGNRLKPFGLIAHRKLIGHDRHRGYEAVEVVKAIKTHLPDHSFSFFSSGTAEITF